MGVAFSLPFVISFCIAVGLTFIAILIVYIIQKYQGVDFIYDKNNNELYETRNRILILNISILALGWGFVIIGSNMQFFAEIYINVLKSYVLGGLLLVFIAIGFFQFVYLIPYMIMLQMQRKWSSLLGIGQGVLITGIINLLCILMFGGFLAVME